VTDEVIVRENEMITPEIARRIEDLGLEKIQVRSPMTCDAALGVCRLCYGMDHSTGSMVEEGMAVGIIAAQSIGEPGTQLTMRTFHIGGSVQTVRGTRNRRQEGWLRQIHPDSVCQNDEGNNVVLTRNGEIALLDPKGRELEKYEVPMGSVLMVEENQEVPPPPSSASGIRTAFPFWPKWRARSATKTSSKAQTMRRKKILAGTSAA
jgi:DNA-directed RNA polymerase subunit beta'